MLGVDFTELLARPLWPNGLKKKNLKKCPWCGAEEMLEIETTVMAGALRSAQVICSACGSRGPVVDSHEDVLKPDTEEEIIREAYRRWNDRAHRT